MQLSEENVLDPLEINELIFQQTLFLPLTQEGSLQTSQQPLVFKMMRMKNMESIIIYILSQIDLYFLFKIEVSSQRMAQLNITYKLSLKRLSDFVQFMKSSLDDIQNQLKSGAIEVTSQYNHKKIAFTITKIVGGKNHLVMKLQGEEESRDLIKDHAAFMYGNMRERLQRKQNRIEYLRELIRLKNPYLLKHIKQS